MKNPTTKARWTPTKTRSPVIAGRVPESLHRQIKAAAKKSNRSLSDEMAWRIGLSYKLEDQNKTLNAILDAMVMRDALHGQLFTSVLGKELRSRGLDEQNTRELEELIEAFFGKEKGYAEHLPEVMKIARDFLARVGRSWRE